MTWNISRVYNDDDDQNRPILIVEGFNDTTNQCLRSTIRKTTLADVLQYSFNYNEHYSISIINPNEVYEIIIYFDTHINKYMDMQSKPYVPITEHRYFDGPWYMGLPMIVFGQWRGVVTVD